MLLIAGFFLLFLLAGLAFVAFSDRDDDVLLAPAAGFAGSMLLAYFLSANFRLSGGVSYAIAAGTLAVAGPILCAARGRAAALAKALVRASPFLLPGLILLIPAFLAGPTTFFGSVNFDFFWNTQDSHFLANAHFHAPPLIQRSALLPLNWGGGGGMFGTSLAAATAFRVWGADPLAINAALLAALVLVHAWALGAFVRTFFDFPYWLALAAASVALLSAGFAIGFYYSLLGQTAGLPVFVLAMVLARRCLDTLAGHGGSQWGGAFAVALGANALYVVYPVLAGFFAAIFALAIALTARRAVSRGVKTVLATGGAGIAVFLVARIGALEALWRTVLYWFGSVTTVAAGSTIGVEDALVFTDFATEAAPALFAGLSTYPTSASWWQEHLPDARTRGGALLIAGSMALVSMAAAVAMFAPRGKGADAARALVLALGLTVGVAFLAFFVGRGTYAMFKISTWFAPLLLPLFVAPWRVAQGRARRIAPLLALGGWAVIALNGTATWRYLSAFADPRAPNPFVNAPGLSGPGIGELAQAIRALPASRVHFALPNPFETAWLANALRDRDTVALAQNDQVLALVKNFADPCGRPPPPLGSGLLVVAAPDSPAVDIVPPPRGPAPLAAAGQWRVLAADEVDLLVFVGRGAYPATPLEPAVARAIGFPERLRWVERHFEIWIHSRVERIADVDIELVPGYVAAPLARRYVTTVDGVARTHELRGLETRIALEGVALRAGYTCVSIASPDAVARQARHGALFRADLPVDGRLLNFAAGPIGVRPRD